MWGLIEEFGLWWRAVKDLIFPRRCLVCGRLLEEYEQYLCIGCYAEMPLTRFCNWCGNPEERLMWQTVGITNAFSLFFYRQDSNYSLLTQKVKYQGWLRFGRILGEELAGQIVSSGRAERIDAVVPVPLHWKRRWQRGYNQAEVICQGVSEVLGIPVINILRRSKYTKTQTVLGHEDKIRNVANSFRVRKNVALKANQQGVRHVLLIDDVITSGSTLSACATPLLDYFEVSIAAVAYVGDL